MSPIVTTIIGLVVAAPQTIAQVEALWNEVKSTYSAKDQATVDGVLAFLNPKVDTDIAALHAAVLA